MKAFIQVQDTRIIQISDRRNVPNDIEIETDDDHEVLRNPFVYKFVDGVLLKDDAYQQYLIDQQNEISPMEKLQQEQELMRQALDELILGGSGL